MYLPGRHSFALSVPFLIAVLMAQVPLLRGLQVWPTTDPSPNPGTDARIVMHTLGVSIRGAHSCPTVDSLESLMRPATSRDAFFENVRNKNPLPTAENPLRLVPAMS